MMVAILSVCAFFALLGWSLLVISRTPEQSQRPQLCRCCHEPEVDEDGDVCGACFEVRTLNDFQIARVLDNYEAQMRFFLLSREVQRRGRGGKGAWL